MKGILGRKVGMTQVFSKEGKLIPVTVVEVEPNTVMQVKTLEKDGYNAIQLGVFDKKEKYQHLVMNDFILGHKGKIVFDCTSGGVFLASALNKIPVVAIKVVEKSVNEKSTVDTYINVLKQYSGIGRAVVTCIGDIGRNDIMRG